MTDSPAARPGPGLGWQNYTCVCDNHIDRVIAGQTDEQLTKFCGSGQVSGQLYWFSLGIPMESTRL